MRTYDGDVATVLEAGFPVLIYVGTEDAMCNYMVSERGGLDCRSSTCCV